MEMQSVFQYVQVQLHTNKVRNHNFCNRAAGQTVISVTDASVFGVGDIVNFGETGNIEYETTATSTTDSTITIKLLDDVNGQGLQNQISSGTNIRRRWRFYDLFDGVQALPLMQQKEVEELVTKCILLFMITQVNNLGLM